MHSEPVTSPPHQVNRKLQRQIGVELRAIYQAVLDEPVPQRFRELIAELEQKQKEKHGE